MSRHMGRPRSKNNKDLPEGLHAPAGGRGCWRMTHPITGKIKSLKTKIRAEAIERYWAIKKHYTPDVAVIAAEFAGGELVSTLAERYRVEVLPTATNKTGNKPLDVNTRRTYDNYLENVHAAHIFKKPVSLFGDADEGPRLIRQYLAPWLNKPKTYNYRLSLLTRLFDWIVDNGLSVRNPCDPINRRTALKRDVYMTDEQFIQLTAKLEQMFHEVYARACDWLYLMSGRPTNMLDVKETQILDTPAEIHYYASKNDLPVIVERDPELDALIEWFRDYKRAQGIVSPYLIVHPADAGRGLARRSITAERLYRYFKRAMAALSIEGFTLRDIRPKALTDEAKLAGEATNKGAHKTRKQREEYVRVTLPVRVKNNLKRLKAS